MARRVKLCPVRDGQLSLHTQPSQLLTSFLLGRQVCLQVAGDDGRGGKGNGVATKTPLSSLDACSFSPICQMTMYNKSLGGLLTKIWPPLFSHHRDGRAKPCYADGLALKPDLEPRRYIVRRLPAPRKPREATCTKPLLPKLLDRLLRQFRHQAHEE